MLRVLAFYQRVQNKYSVLNAKKSFDFHVMRWLRFAITLSLTERIEDILSSVKCTQQKNKHIICGKSCSEKFVKSLIRKNVNYSLVMRKIKSIVMF